MLRLFAALLGVDLLLILTGITLFFTMTDIRRGKVRPVTLLLCVAVVTTWATVIMLMLMIGHYWPNRRACIGDGYAW